MRFMILYRVDILPYSHTPRLLETNLLSYYLCVAVGVWRRGGVAAWRRGGVAARRCRGVAAWRGGAPPARSSSVASI